MTSSTSVRASSPAPTAPPSLANPLHGLSAALAIFATSSPATNYVAGCAASGVPLAARAASNSRVEARESSGGAATPTTVASAALSGEEAPEAMGARAEGVGWDAVRGGMLLDSKKRHLKVQRICNHLPLYLSVCMKTTLPHRRQSPCSAPPQKKRETITQTRNCQFFVLTPRMQSQSTHDMCGEVSGELAGNIHMHLHQCGLSPLSKHVGTRNENANVYEQTHGARRASLMPKDQSESDSADSAGPSTPTKPLNATQMSNATIVGAWIPLPAPARNTPSENNPKSNGQRPPYIMTMASWSKRFVGIVLTPRTPHADG